MTRNSFRGSCCPPEEIKLTISEVDYRTNKAEAFFNPISFMYGGTSSVKLAIIGTVATSFSLELFKVTLKVNDDPNICTACEETRYLSTIEEFEYDVSVANISSLVC